MATPNLQIQNINSLEDQGKALAVSFAVIEKADAKNFKLSLRVDEAKPNSTELRVATHGFDYKLGQLMLSLKAEGGERIPTQRIRDCHLHLIAKQRRAEALWFALNEDEARAFMKSSKKDWGHFGSLKRAMDKADKPPMTLIAPKVEAAVEPKVETPVEPKVETPVEPKVEAVKSNVGPNPNLKVTPTLVVDKMMDIVKANGLDLEEIIEMLMAEQEKLENDLNADDPVDAANTLIAASAVKSAGLPC
tara:strand:+ start:379 stop:1122 length:744 start_codon:yes stop_codon:yes gene_type:complete